MQPDEYEPISRRLAELIQPEMTWFDATTFQIERLMYWPSACADAEYVFRYEDKPFLSADGMLALYEDWRNVSPELMIHALWHISLQKGAPLPDCGIYYAALGRAVASQEEQRAILSNPAGYALCVVRLSPEVEKDDCI